MKQKYIGLTIAVVLWLAIAAALAYFGALDIAQRNNFDKESWGTHAIFGIMFFLFDLPLVLLFGMAIYTFNELVTLRNAGEQTWLDIEVQLQRKANLVPRIVEIAERFLNHEHDTLRDVITARQQLVDATDRDSKLRSESRLTITLGKLLSLVESYPNIVSGSNISILHNEVTATENQIAELRTSYNAAVTEYNNTVETFPQNIIATFFGFKRSTHIRPSA